MVYYKINARGNGKRTKDDWTVDLLNGVLDRLEAEGIAREIQEWNPHIQVGVGRYHQEFKRVCPNRLNSRLPRNNPRMEITNTNWAPTLPDYLGRKPKAYERYGVEIK